MDVDERNQRIIDNLNLVDYVLHRKLHISTYDKYYDDYQQEGRVGLILAAERFDSSREVTFATFAVLYIEGHIRKFRRYFIYSNGIHVSRNTLDMIGKITKLYHEGYTMHEITQQLAITDGEYLDVITLLTMSNFNDVIGKNKEGEDYTLQDIVGQEDTNIVDALGEERVIACIENVANSISNEKHRGMWYDYIYPAYFGEHVTTLELAKKYVISQPQVSRLLNKYKKNLQYYLNE